MPLEDETGAVDLDDGDREFIEVIAIEDELYAAARGYLVRSPAHVRHRLPLAAQVMGPEPTEPHQRSFHPTCVTVTWERTHVGLDGEDVAPPWST